MTTDRIRRLGGTGWLTAEDLKRFSKQAQAILYDLSLGLPMPKRTLEYRAGSKRVAARIDELRDYFIIKTTRGADGMAVYTLEGRRETPRQRKAHCKTCRCNEEAAKESKGGQWRAMEGLGIDRIGKAF